MDYAFVHYFRKNKQTHKRKKPELFDNKRFLRDYDLSRMKRFFSPQRTTTTSVLCLNVNGATRSHGTEHAHTVLHDKWSFQTNHQEELHFVSNSVFFPLFFASNSVYRELNNGYYHW